ncbi:ATP-binding cassette domain-containing protein [Microbacterium halophytorum]|uniref:ATP-binding cassette domain-containing protein n=1 Tax=Microbacterium halophytorum TaxID=2067568 RepID=UPI000CFB4344|nr:ATP-binding cassette domain-containing protein [Microbacterium halophytorum]
MSRAKPHASSSAAVDAHVIVDRRGFRLDARVRVEHGEVVAVMGPPGAGKSTLLNAIAGTLRLSGGSIAFDNDTTATKHRHVRPQKRGVALLGADARLFPHLSARDNVAFGLRVRGVDRAHARTEADEWLWQVGLGGSGDHRPRELSPGQRQRTALARALAAAPRAVLLDEPMAGLEPGEASEIRALLQEQLVATRVAALVVTHDVTDAAALGRRLLVLEGGQITQEGDAADVLARPATPFAAGIAGLNRVVGTGSRGGCLVKASEGPVRIGGGDPALESPAPEPHRPSWHGHELPHGYESTGEVPTASGEGQRVTALFRPSDVTLELAPDTSWTGALKLAREAEPQPGEWLARVVRFESDPSGARVVTDQPRVIAEIPAARLAGMHLAPGDPVRLSVPPERVRIIASRRRAVTRATRAEAPRDE